MYVHPSIALSLPIHPYVCIRGIRAEEGVIVIVVVGLMMRLQSRTGHYVRIREEFFGQEVRCDAMRYQNFFSWLWQQAAGSRQQVAGSRQVFRLKGVVSVNLWRYRSELSPTALYTGIIPGAPLHCTMRKKKEGKKKKTKLEKPD